MEGNQAIRVFTPRDPANGQQTNLVVVIDGSDSMAVDPAVFNPVDPFFHQLEGLARTLEHPDYLPRDGSIALAIVQMAGSARIELPLTVLDSAATANQLATQIRAIQQIEGGTAMAAGLQQAVQALQEGNRPNAEQVIALVTDGQPDSRADALAAATAALAGDVDEITAMGVGLGSNLLFLDELISQGEVIALSDFVQFAGVDITNPAPDPENVSLTTGAGSHLHQLVTGRPLGEYSTLTQAADGSYTRTYTDGTRAGFSSAGFHTTLIDRNDNTTRFSYSGEALTQVTDPVGKVTQFAYENNGRLSRITLPDGRVTDFIHDASGNLTQVTDPDGSRRQFAYDGSLLNQQTNQRDLVTQYNYDHASRLTGSNLPDGASRSILPSQTRAVIVDAASTSKESPAPAVSANDISSTFTDGEGNSSQYLTDSFGRTLQVTDPLNRKLQQQRDIYGNVTQLIRPNNSESRYEYDARGNLSDSEPF